MNLRTPRRRISPQTKLRCRAIKGFFKRTRASASQPDLQITSSIAINVTDLKHKIIGLEKQLDEVSRHCRDLNSIETSPRQSQRLIPIEIKDKASKVKIPTSKQNTSETHIIYKPSERQFNKFSECSCTPKRSNESNNIKSSSKMNELCETPFTKNKKKKSKDDIRDDMMHNFHKHKTQSVCDNLVSSYSTSSFYSLAELKKVRLSNPGYGEEKRNDDHKHHKNKINRKFIDKTYLDGYESRIEESQQKYSDKRKGKRAMKQLDQDFIEDIIKRQYRPVKMFGRKESDISQYSAPVCRDLEFCLQHNLQEDTERFDVYGGHHSTKYAHAIHSDYSDIRSVYDTRIYSSKRSPRFKRHKYYGEYYNNSDIYDLVPVKEKASPKSRRKFVEDNMAPYANYKEVPPSPKSHRPRLNLKAQNQYYYIGNDENDFNKERHRSRKVSPKITEKHRYSGEVNENCQSSPQIKKNKDSTRLTTAEHLAQIQQEIGGGSSLKCPTFLNNQSNIDETPLNKSQEIESSAEKTDKVLCEIKDILQNFLQEIKKEASSQGGQSDASTKMTENCTSNPQITNAMPNSGLIFDNYSAAQCPLPASSYMPFGNTCCYPVLPVCPMNCMQNSYLIPRSSYTCATCVNKGNDTNHNDNIMVKNEAPNGTLKPETDELIKEIYEFVAQSPKFRKKQDDTVDTRILTSRSAGGHTPISRRNAKVGTPKTNCCSKSCEAIGSRMITDTYSSDVNTSYSETVLDKLSLEVTQSASELESTTEDSDKYKGKQNKFANVLKSFGLFKKKPKDVIEEVTESDSTTEVKGRKRPPFQQEITNYVMHGQEYHRPPPVHQHYGPAEYLHPPHRPPYDPRLLDYPPTGDPYGHPVMARSMNEHGSPHPHYPPGQHPAAPPYSSTYEGYNQMHSQVPLCLKEIEVKSIGCQSERKLSFFGKITKKMQQPDEARVGQAQKTCSTQTAQTKQGLLNWKSLQAKAMAGRTDPMDFSLKTQKKLAEGDVKMRNAMLKKLFYKRNPFSPRNLIVRTLMGKDRSSFGDPPTAYRPRMFM